MLALMEKHRGSGGAVPPSGPGLHKLVKGMLQVRASASDERVGGSVSDALSVSCVGSRMDRDRLRRAW